METEIAVFLTHPVVPSWNFTENQSKILLEAIPGIKIRNCQKEEDFIESLKTARIALIWYFKQEWLDSAPALEWIVTPAAGMDYFKLTPKKNQTVSYCSFHGQIIAETVIGMILAHIRGIRDCLLVRNKRPWPQEEIWPRMRNFRGSHIGILGFGHIGEWIARLAKPLGARITGLRRHPADRPDYFTGGDKILPVSALPAVLPETDHLVLALPGGPETDNLISQKELSLLPSHAAVYNVGRGNAINEQDLIAALTSKTIEAAYLDVFKTEPLPPESPLRKCQNLFIMPHASAIAPNYLDLFVDEFIEKYRKKYN